MLWTTLALLLPFAALPLIGIFAWEVWRRRHLTLEERRQRRLAWSLVPALLLVGGEAILVWGSHNERHYWDGWTLSLASEQLRPSDLAGTWRSEADSVTLAADGTMVDPRGHRGRWVLEERWLVAGGRRWVPLRRHGELVLLPDPGDLDADNWNKWTCWERSPTTPPAGTPHPPGE